MLGEHSHDCAVYVGLCLGMQASHWSLVSVRALRGSRITGGSDLTLAFVVSRLGVSLESMSWEEAVLLHKICSVGPVKHVLEYPRLAVLLKSLDPSTGFYRILDSVGGIVENSS